VRSADLINCTACEVAAMIEGAMRHGTTMDVEANYTDSHGQSEIERIVALVSGADQDDAGPAGGGTEGEDAQVQRSTGHDRRSSSESFTHRSGTAQDSPTRVTPPQDHRRLRLVTRLLPAPRPG
jgi:hypothetical protein